MIYDRPYMTTSFDEQAKKTLIWIIGVNVGVFVFQLMLNAFGVSEGYLKLFALHKDSITSGFIWAPITYSVLHSTASIGHVVFNMLMLFFLGRAILPTIGQKRFVQVYLLSAVGGGLLWYTIALFTQPLNPVLGASGAVFGILALFCLINFEREMQFLLFFVLPVRMKPKYILYFALGVSVIGFLFYELGSSKGGVAHSAHLGGILGGYLFYKLAYLKNPYADNTSLSFSIPKIFRKKSDPKKKADTYRYNVNISSNPKDIKAEVDRILDKINSKGFGSLTPAEKKILDEARDVLRRR